MSISAKDVKQLRDRTGAGMMDCKKALVETNGDMEAAIDLLRTKGAAKAAKRAEKSTNEGTIGNYVHFDNRTAVIVELNCETDFVANTDDFKQLAKDLATHIAAMDPMAVTVDQISNDVVERERQIYLEQVRSEGKPENVQERIVEGKLRKFFQDRVLMEQRYVKDPDKSIGDLITETSAKTGEKVEIARFARMQVGSR